MRAFVLHGHGGPDKLVFHEDWPKPEPGPMEALVEVSACGLNNTDVNNRTGWYDPAANGPTGEAFRTDGPGASAFGGALSFPLIQGADVVGRVVGLGDGADPGLLGQRVMVDPWLRDWDAPKDIEKTGFLGGERNGGFAEFVAVDSRNLLPVRTGLSDTDLATFATSYTTAEQMLNRVKLHAGETVLITGASGGVGVALVQLARMRGAKTVALASDAKHDAVRALGATAVLPRAPDDLPAALNAAIGRPHVDVVADVVGGPLWPQLIKTLRRGGRYVCAGAIAGPMVHCDLRQVYLNDLTLHGSTVVAPGVFADVVGYVTRHEVDPQLARVFPLEQLHDAQTAFMSKAELGNIVVML